MNLLEPVRRGPARPHLVTAAYHTPNGPLHLGHIGGPFLSADVVARHLETLGHPVARISATDSHESYILMTARRGGLAPEEVASRYHDEALAALTGLGMHQDAWPDMHRAPYRAIYHERSHATVADLERRGRLVRETEKLLHSSTTGQGLVGAFVQGRCPACGSGAAGSSCESCGLWFGPADLIDPRPVLPEDGTAEPRTVTSVFLTGDPRRFSGEEAARRFPPGYADLLETYVTHNGRRIRLNHPLGWGVPWRGGAAGDVHLSYGTGTYAAFSVLRDLYRTADPAGRDAFARDTDVVTIATGGYDATLPWMFVLAFMDDETDWQPHQHHIMNRFLLLNGSKFSTSRGHVIWAHDYLRAALPVDPLRGYLASLSDAGEESDFRTADFADWTSRVLAGRWDPAIRRALRDAAGDETAVPDSFTAEALTALTATADALRPPTTSPRAALAVLDDWITRAERGLAPGEPAPWLAVLAVLAWPLMPTLGTQLWTTLGRTDHPTLATPLPTRVVTPEAFEGLPTVTRSAVEALLPEAGGS
ncbi:class I tRNA ligase family protein [Streptomyces sp. t39]|uniref:class I tRNA ligase family protein n=1 Tax=Streptomyces sp. t39 TaxID=1828156 RepID=UPI00164FF028|nr:class I tRNA ligase family protein [Streptomyces sp. t39]